MSDPTFLRGSLPDLWVGLATNVPLGLVDGRDLVQDHFGTPGAVSLLHVPSGAWFTVPVVLWGFGSRNLGGRVPMALLPAGAYRIQGRLADQLGSVVNLDLGFVLEDGAAPENNGVFLSAPGPDGSVAFEPQDASRIVIMLCPGLSVAFPGGGPAAVTFPPVNTQVRFR